jgi:nucleoside-diphosphate-sugar epimerase
MNIFVTGASGVIGRRAVPLFLAAGHRVTAAARSPDKARALARSGAAAVQVDLFDQAALTEGLRGHDAVVNLATHMPSGTIQTFLPGAWKENDRIRRDGSRIVAAAAKTAGVARYVQESFAPVYPDSGDRWIDESVAIRPAAYNRTVADAEESVRRFAEQGGIGITLRFANFYGHDSLFVRETVRMIRRGWAPLPSSPEAYFSSASHDDAAAAVVAALELPAGIYNVGDDEPLRRRDLFDAIAEALHVRPPRIPPLFLSKLMGSVGETLARSLRISNRKLRESAGWKPRWSSAREGWEAAIARIASEG